MKTHSQKGAQWHQRQANTRAQQKLSGSALLAVKFQCRPWAVLCKARVCCRGVLLTGQVCLEHPLQQLQSSLTLWKPLLVSWTQSSTFKTQTFGPLHLKITHLFDFTLFPLSPGQAASSALHSNSSSCRSCLGCWAEGSSHLGLPYTTNKGDLTPKQSHPFCTEQSPSIIPFLSRAALTHIRDPQESLSSGAWVQGKHCPYPNF